MSTPRWSWKPPNLAITYAYRFVPDTISLKQVIDRKLIGDLMEIRYIRLGPNEMERPMEGTLERRKADMIYTHEMGMNYDCGVHAMDLFRWYSNSDIKKITAQGICRMGYDYPDGATAILEMENSIRCIYDHGSMPFMSDFAGHVFMIILTGRKGSAVWRLGGRSVPGEMWGNSCIDIYTPAGPQWYEFPIYEKGRDLQYQQFAQAIETETLEGTNFPTPEDAVKATEAGLLLIKTLLNNIQK
jgi:predicted dehydrogenase